MPKYDRDPAPEIRSILIGFSTKGNVNPERVIEAGGDEKSVSGMATIETIRPVSVTTGMNAWSFMRKILRREVSGAYRS
jgi:hypothetical protein